MNPAFVCPCYSEVERKIYMDHIYNYFGFCANTFYDPLLAKTVDILIMYPSQDHPHYRLITCGLGAKRMAIPDELQCEYISEYIELMMTLPAGWAVTPETMQQRSYWWPAYLMLDVVEAIEKEKIWVLPEDSLSPKIAFSWSPGIQQLDFKELEDYPLSAQNVALAVNKTVKILELIPRLASDDFYDF